MHYQITWFSSAVEGYSSFPMWAVSQRYFFTGHPHLLVRQYVARQPNETQAEPRLRGTQVAAPGSTLATLDIQENDAVRAVGYSAWLGVFISAPAKSTSTRIELYPREFVFCPYRDLRVKGLRIIERRYCHVNPFRTDFVLDKQRRATTRSERA